LVKLRNSKHTKRQKAESQMESLSLVDSLSDRQYQVVLHTHEVQIEYISYWRRIVVDITFFLITGMIALVGFAITRQDIKPPVKLGVCLLVLILGWSGAAIARLVKRVIYKHARIVLKIDHINRVFQNDVYLQGDSLYPKNWLTYGSSTWREPVLSFCFWILVFMPLLLGAITMIVQ
jgi:hypothetical protein